MGVSNNITSTTKYMKPRKKYEYTKDLSLSFILKQNMSIVGTCWIWRRSTSNKGYGELGYHGVSTLVHIFAYKEWVGKIPIGMTVDHLCRNKLCINPQHLEIISKIENRQRSGRKKIQCLNGHKLLKNSINCYWKKYGIRHCKICQNESKMIHGYYYA